MTPLKNSTFPTAGSSRTSVCRPRPSARTRGGRDHRPWRSGSSGATKSVGVVAARRVERVAGRGDQAHRGVVAKVLVEEAEGVPPEPPFGGWTRWQSCEIGAIRARRIRRQKVQVPFPDLASQIELPP